jgi:hypothetical protein
MFKKITEFRPPGNRAQQVRTAAQRDAASRADRRLIAGARRIRRPILTCRWHVVRSTGKLECRWRSAAASDVDKAGQKRAARSTRRPTRARAPAGRPTVGRAA